MDESENSNCDRKDIFSVNVFGLSGILITPRYATNLILEFCGLRRLYNIPDDWEIHGFEIFSGSGRWSKKFDDKTRRLICKELAKLIAKKNRLAKAWFCYKESQLLKNDYLITLEGLLNKSCDFIGKCGGNTNKQLLVIFDQKDEFEIAINKFILGQRNLINSSKKGGKCRVIDHGFPGKSELSELLQLSDFIGYIFRLSKTLKRKDTLLSKKHDQRFIDFVDELTDIMKKKVGEIKI
ncbi:MAG: DUF3800 domain-containing protein [Patescibacteria group bacterium]